jgi:hypothetical protein
MSGDKEKYQIISPDGLPITDEPFESKQEALAYVHGWRDHFQQQGYYAGVSKRISLEELAGHLTIVPESEVEDVMKRMNDKSVNPVATALESLMEQAEEYGRASMARFGEVPPTLFLSGPEGASGFCRDDLSDESKRAEFLTIGRMLCIAQRAEVAVFCASGWAQSRARDSAVEATIGCAQAEAVFIFGESVKEQLRQILPVQRSDDEEFVGFAKEVEIGDARVKPDFGRFLPETAPDEAMQLEAQRFLAARKMVKVRTRREIGMGRVM